jgi:hypothetical protein
MNTSLFIHSLVIFVFINIIENLIHYSIGRGSDTDKGIVFYLPTGRDLVKIVFIMIIFGLMQGWLTAMWPGA